MTRRIAFLLDRLLLTGPSVSLYNYAHYNETLLKNQSIVFTRPYDNIKQDTDSNPGVYERFSSRFPVVYYNDPSEIDNLLRDQHIDVLYIMKAGSDEDNLSTTVCRCVIHCLDTSISPHGDVYAVIGPAVNERNKTSCPIVPPMIEDVSDTGDDIQGDLRTHLGIPASAIVFGRYGSYESFDIPFVHECIDEWKSPNVIFLCMNTKPFTVNPQVIYLNGSCDPKVKKLFLRTCDAFLHAHQQGEAFGVACGEAMLCGKHVITYGQGRDTTHLQLLGRDAIVYSNKGELTTILHEFLRLKKTRPMNVKKHLYATALSPKNVMQIFQRTFLGK